MNYVNDPEYFGTEIMFCSHCNLQFLFAYSHVLPDTKLGFRDSNPQFPEFHPASYSEDVCVGHSRRRHTSCVDCVIIILDKFRQNSIYRYELENVKYLNLSLIVL